MEDRLTELASQLEAVEDSLADLGMEALRSQLHGDEAAKELERRLARARRAVAKARGLLHELAQR